MPSCTRSEIIIPDYDKDRVEKLALEIFNRHREVTENNHEPLVMLCVLKGAHQFLSDLYDKLVTLSSQGNVKGSSIRMSVEFIRVKSYVNAQSTDSVNIVGFTDLESALKGRHVLIVEDIVDTGKTMRRLIAHLHQFDPARLSVACLVRKRTPLSDNFVPDHVGFEVPNKFVVGGGFDYNEHFRDMKHICAMNDHGIEKYKQEQE